MPLLAILQYLEKIGKFIQVWMIIDNLTLMSPTYLTVLNLNRARQVANIEWDDFLP